MGSSLKSKGHPEKMTTAGPVDDLHSRHLTPGFSTACDNTRPVPSWLRSLVTHHLKAAPRLPLPRSQPRLLRDTPSNSLTARPLSSLLLRPPCKPHTPLLCMVPRPPVCTCTVTTTPSPAYPSVSRGGRLLGHSRCRAYLRKLAVHLSSNTCFGNPPRSPLQP